VKGRWRSGRKRATTAEVTPKAWSNWATCAASRSRAEAMDYYTRAVAVGDMPETVPALIQLGLDAYKHDPAARGTTCKRARNASKSGNDMGRAMTWLAFIRRKDEPARPRWNRCIGQRSRWRTRAFRRTQATTAEFLARYLRNHDRAGRSGAPGGAGEKRHQQGDRGDDYESRGRGLFGGEQGRP